MKTTWLFLALGALNLLLLGSNGVLLSALRFARMPQENPEVKALSDERARLAVERARLQSRIAELGIIVQRLGPAIPAGEMAERAPDEDNPEVGVPTGDSPAEIRKGSGKPDPFQIEILPVEELDRLKRERMKMPFELSGNVLLRGDPDLVLADPLWNPGGRALDGEERAELARLIDDYRYFARTSAEERFHTWVEPEIPRMRAAGAYLEYPERQPPPPIPGARVSHSEPSERPGYRRLYYFFPEDYPDLFHHRQVSKERGLERFVEIYTLINGGI